MKKHIYDRKKPQQLYTPKCKWLAWFIFVHLYIVYTKRVRQFLISSYRPFKIRIGSAGSQWRPLLLLSVHMLRGDDHRHATIIGWGNDQNTSQMGEQPLQRNWLSFAEHGCQIDMARQLIGTLKVEFRVTS